MCDTLQTVAQIDSYFRDITKKGMLALLMCLHQRCGKSSPAHILNKWILHEIVDFAFQDDLEAQVYNTLIDKQYISSDPIRHIEIVMAQTGAGKYKAMTTLLKYKGDIVEAIMELTD
jgi:NACalpha-BTF3-like transcription factor